jgi:hypothetical protein
MLDPAAISLFIAVSKEHEPGIWDCPHGMGPHGTGLLLPGSLPAPCTSRKLHIGGVGYAVLPPGLRCEPAASGSTVVWARGRTDGPHPRPAAYLVVTRPAEPSCILEAHNHGQLTLTHIAQRPGKAVRCGTGPGYHIFHVWLMCSTLCMSWFSPACC